jgi:cytochrome c oxidase subunit 2
MTTHVIITAMLGKQVIYGRESNHHSRAVTTGETMTTWKSLFLKYTTLLGIIAGALTVTHAQDKPKRIEITASRFAFAPGEITLKKGEPVVLVMKSADVAHGIRIRELHVELNAKAGATGEATFTPAKTGTFVGHCSVFCGAGHGSMMLTLHVVD